MVLFQFVFFLNMNSFKHSTSTSLLALGDLWSQLPLLWCQCSTRVKGDSSLNLHSKTVLWLKGTTTHLGCTWWHSSEPPEPFPLLVSGRHAALTPLLQHVWWPWTCGGTGPESRCNPRDSQQTLLEPKPSTQICECVCHCNNLSWRLYSKRKPPESEWMWQTVTTNCDYTAIHKERENQTNQIYYTVWGLTHFHQYLGNILRVGYLSPLPI